MFCSECGYQLKESARFCPNCGTPVTDLVSAAEPRVERSNESPAHDVASATSADFTQTQVKAPVSEAENTVITPAVPTESDIPDNVDTVLKKHGITKKQAIIAGAGAVAVVAVIAGILIVRTFLFADAHKNPVVDANEHDVAARDAETDTTEDQSTSVQADSSSTTASKTAEELSVGDYKIGQDPSGIDMLTFTVTNNTKDVISGSFKFTGSFVAKDNYGDDIKYEDDGNINLYVPVTQLQPGENTVVAYANAKDNIVAYYSASGSETLKYTLNDASDIQIDVTSLPSNVGQELVFLKSDEYKVETNTSVDQYGSKQVKLSITNKTNFRWRNAYITVEALDDKEGIAAPDYVMYSFKTETIQYVKPGETKDTDVYLSTSDYSKLKILNVVVEKEPDIDGDTNKQ